MLLLMLEKGKNSRERKKCIRVERVTAEAEEKLCQDSTLTPILPPRSVVVLHSRSTPRSEETCHLLSECRAFCQFLPNLNTKAEG